MSAPGGYWGVRLPHNGSWTGMMGQLERGEADLSIAGFTITMERAEAVDFIGALFTTHAR